MKEIRSYYPSQIPLETQTTTSETTSIKHERKQPKNRLRVPSLALGAVTLLGALSVSCTEKQSVKQPPTALIIDQLAFTDNNPDFIDQTMRLLIADGFVIEGVPAQNVTVEMYRVLPSSNADLVIIRSHSTGIMQFKDKPNEPVKNIGLFTQEPYTYNKYIPEQIALEVAPSSYPDKPGVYFGVNEFFVKNAMQGKFNGSTIIMTGCNGAETDGMAQAFFSKGAKTFIGWDNSVTAEHTDKATEILLKHLETEDMSPQDAVTATNAEVGPDPTFGGKLVAFEKPKNN